MNPRINFIWYTFHCFNENTFKMWLSKFQQNSDIQNFAVETFVTLEILAFDTLASETVAFDQMAFEVFRERLKMFFVTISFFTDAEEIGMVKTMEEKFKKDHGYKVYAFNTLVSDKIGSYRSVPDTRNKQYIYFFL